jgi:hypothetical protein
MIDSKIPRVRMRRLARPGRSRLSGARPRAFPRAGSFSTRPLAEASSLARAPVPCPEAASRRPVGGVLLESII